MLLRGARGPLLGANEAQFPTLQARQCWPHINVSESQCPGGPIQTFVNPLCSLLNSCLEEYRACFPALVAWQHQALQGQPHLNEGSSQQARGNRLAFILVFVYFYLFSCSSLPLRGSEAHDWTLEVRQCHHLSKGCSQQARGRPLDFPSSSITLYIPVTSIPFPLN